MNTKDVADFILDISLDKLPPDVITRAKLCTLDTFDHHCIQLLLCQGLKK